MENPSETYIKYRIGRCKTNKAVKQLIELSADCPEEKAYYEVEGKKYTIIRHFTGEKDINQVIAELAVSRANREMGLS